MALMSYSSRISELESALKNCLIQHFTNEETGAHKWLFNVYLVIQCILKLIWIRFCFCYSAKMCEFEK